MRRIVITLLVLVSISIYCSSCARGISTYDAANGRARCGRYIR